MKSIIQEKIAYLASIQAEPCVSISFNTHRTRPDSDKDRIVLKNLIKTAEDRLKKQYDKKIAERLIKQIADLTKDINYTESFDSMHIYVSSETQNIIKTTWSTFEDRVHIADKFDLRPLIKAYNRSKSYLILYLRKDGANLYEAMNDAVIDEVRENNFPFTENPHYIKEPLQRGDALHVDKLQKEFINKIDKALVKTVLESGLYCIVVCTDEVYGLLKQVADRPEFYAGQISINSNEFKETQIAKQTWEIIEGRIKQNQMDAIKEMADAVSKAHVLTDLASIYHAAKNGRGDLLIVHDKFSQPVVINDDGSLDTIMKSEASESEDDIVNVIAWEVLSKGGRVYFTEKGGEKAQKIALKVRY